MIQGVEEARDVSLQHPASMHLHQPFPQAVQCLVCRPLRPETVREVIEVLLVHRFQHHQHRPLQDLVLKARYPDRAGLAPIPLQNLHPAHWRREVPPRLEPLQKRPQVVDEVTVGILISEARSGDVEAAGGALANSLAEDVRKKNLLEAVQWIITQEKK